MREKQRGFFLPIIDLFPLQVCFSLLKCLHWEKHCNYLMTTTQGDRFASCENIVSRSQNSSSPPPPPRDGWWNTSINYVGWYVVAQILPVFLLFYFVSNQLTYRRQTKTKLNWFEQLKRNLNHHPRVIKRLNYPVSPLFGHKTARRLKVNYKVTLFLTSSVGSLSFNCLKTSPCFFISCWISVLENEVSLDAILHCWSAACKTAQNPEDSEVYLFG